MDFASVGNRCVVKQGAFRLVDVDVGQTAATPERLISDFRDAGRNCDTGQAFATIECFPSDYRDTIRNRNTDQVGTILERTFSD